MIPKKVASKVHYSEYWVRPESKWGLDSWDQFYQEKYPEKAKRESHIALGGELKVLLKFLEPTTRKGRKALELSGLLKQGNKKKKFPKQVDSEDSENDPKILNIDCLGKSISHYKIIFLPEEYANDVYEQESTVIEFANEDVEGLIESYNNSISTIDKTMLKVLDTISLGINEFNMKKDWELLWVQSIYKIFLICFMDPYNPLLNSDFNEYSYRSRIVDRLIEDPFFDSTNIRVIIGEVENVDRKKQKDSGRKEGERRNIGWLHDILLRIRVNNVDYQVAFREVVGNAFIQDEAKKINDLAKLLKAMQLALSCLRRILIERQVSTEVVMRLETFGIFVYRKDFIIYGMHYHNDEYLVDEIDKFSLPDNLSELHTLSYILKSILCFKKRILNLQELVEKNVLLGMHRQGPRFTKEKVIASPKNKKRS
ncbi:hypothetical protein C1646_755200 [Rhizophagus diaphanus]|nr:hypothetical protein C1646_755200 [Rhizophagus diaphanus] [Rhizophagus sp. MUCL 43196]